MVTKGGDRWVEQMRRRKNSGAYRPDTGETPVLRGRAPCADRAVRGTCNCSALGLGWGGSQRMAKKISNGTWLVVALLAFAVLIAVGRAWLKRTGDRYDAPKVTVPAAR